MVGLLIMGSVLMLTPFAWMISSSLKTGTRKSSKCRRRLMPSQIEWHNYPDSLGKDKMNLCQTLPNTVVITVCCVLGQIISSSLVGFGFARFRFRGRGTAVSGDAQHDDAAGTGDDDSAVHAFSAGWGGSTRFCR